METKKKPKLSIKKGDWCVMHWLGGDIRMFGTEKDCRACREKSSIVKCNENWIKREPRKKVVHSDAVDTCYFGKRLIAPKNEHLL